MDRSRELSQLPDNLPAPVDDGAADHLIGRALPAVRLASTAGGWVSLSELSGSSVLYVYPMTGQPGRPLPDGWDMIPGARGCTPQACSFRDHSDELRELGVTDLFGISTQSTDYQSEVVERLHLPFELLSDAACTFGNALSLPAFEVEGMRLLRRITLIANDGVITKVFYPVFPPNQAAQAVIDHLRENGGVV